VLTPTVGVEADVEGASEAGVQAGVGAVVEVDVVFRFAGWVDWYPGDVGDDGGYDEYAGDDPV
jgi:hypothetical protein